MGHEPKTIWIIGAGSGIGASLSKILSGEGHRIILSGRRVDKLQAVQSECMTCSEIVPLDVTKDGGIASAYASIKENIGQVDSVIFMSAVYHPMDIDKIDLSLCEQSISTNLAPAFSIFQSVVPDMKSRGTGQIILCGSVAGYRGLPHAQPYSATKAALINLAQSARLDLAGYGIDVKIINPGFVKTEMTDKNSFSMPMIITSEQAAVKIATQMFRKNRFEIRTHGIFSWMMRAIRILPDCIYFRVMRR